MTTTALINAGFTQCPNYTFTREFSREVNVAFHGAMTTRFVVSIRIVPGAVIATFEKNGMVVKHKRYSSSLTRAWNAIKETILWAGFEI